MANHLPVPPELLHLIEKREDQQRRKADRRGAQDRRLSDQGPIGSIESVDDLDEMTLTEQRLGGERRENEERRKDGRRGADADCTDSG